MPSRPLALVTGASVGIGRELARVLAERGHDLALVARREAQLAEVAAELRERYGVEALVVPADLTAPDAAAQVLAALGDRPVDVLVNNAGFGGVGAFAQRPRADDLRMVALNVTALTDLTKQVLPGMLARGHGRVLNVASTAAFQPGPFMAVYYATKAYVLSLSQALSEEVSGTGVTVTCLCPGVTESEFHRVAGTDRQPLTSGPVTMSARSVAVAGVDGMLRGRMLVIPGLHNRLGAEAVRLAPRRALLKIVRRLHPAGH